MRVLTAEAMAQVDRRAIEELGLPGAVLMENAALGVVEALEDEAPGAGSALLLCGPGNNGGDGLAVGRHLAIRGWQVEIFLFAPAPPSGDAAMQLDVVRRMGLPVRSLDGPEAVRAALASGRESDVVVDALFGTGLSRPLEGDLASLVEGLSDVPGLRLAVDVPSGLHGSRWDVPGPAFRADVTVTFGAPKIAHVLLPAALLAGRIAVADLGIPLSLLEEAEGDLELLEARQLGLLLGGRARDAHKGTYGHLLVVAGSRGKSGAAVLACRAAVRSGAGLVTAAVPAGILSEVASGSVESMTLPLADDGTGEVAEAAVDEVLEACEGRDAVALGPGLGRSADVLRRLRRVVLSAPLPLVLDADGLIAFADDLAALRDRPAETVLTPHPGEMAALLGGSIGDVQADRPAAVRRAAEASGCHVVLKGAPSLVATPGGRIGINPTGNPGMATGGTGDVLTGVVGALLAGGLDGGDAARLGTYLHGLAGDLALEAGDEAGLRAGDLVEALPAALSELRAP
ncbi:MAG: NAD(P)H-hydrate dehydratase [Thermoanaerobaculia bacterium]